MAAKRAICSQPVDCHGEASLPGRKAPSRRSHKLGIGLPPKREAHDDERQHDDVGAHGAGDLAIRRPKRCLEADTGSSYDYKTGGQAGFDFQQNEASAQKGTLHGMRGGVRQSASGFPMKGSAKSLCRLHTSVRRFLFWFLYGLFTPSERHAAGPARSFCWERIMIVGAEQAVALDRLDDALRLAPTPSPELFRKIIDRGGTRLRALRQSGKAAWIDRLIEAGAWTEAALALIELEMPAWKVRRLVYENGEWLCSLSQQPHLPIGLDDTVEAGHDILVLAVLRALVEARRRSIAAPGTSSAAPDVLPTSDRMICCDNFA